VITFKESRDATLWDRIDRRVVEIAQQLHDQVIERKLGKGITVTSTIRNSGVHAAKRAADVRTWNLALDTEGKAMLSLEVNAWAQERFGFWTRSYCIFEWPENPTPELRNTEHFHIQVPAWGCQFPEVDS
jgi:hypothetical protein